MAAVATPIDGLDLSRSNQPERLVEGCLTPFSRTGSGNYRVYGSGIPGTPTSSVTRAPPMPPGGPIARFTTYSVCLKPFPVPKARLDGKSRNSRVGVDIERVDAAVGVHPNDRILRDRCDVDGSVHVQGNSVR